MALELIAWLLLALIGIGLSAVFSGMETGLYTINRVRLTVRASRGERQALRLRSIIARPNRMLSTLLIGNNIANYAGSFGIAAILELYGVAPITAIIVNVVILVSLLFVFGETLPKDLFRTHTDDWSYSLAGFLSGCAAALTWTGLGPIVERAGAIAAKLMGADAKGLPGRPSGSLPGSLPGALGGARRRISELIKEGISVGVLSEAQTALADRALAMRELRVASERVPWREVVTISAAASPEQRRAVIERHHFTRFPVMEGSKVIGVITMLDALLEAEKPTRELIQSALEIESRASVRQALRRMREARTPMAIVVGRPCGPPIGIVTFKDLVEPLTGELRAW